MMRLASALALTALYVGCSDECQSGGDCKASETCTEGACVPRQVQPPPIVRDGGTSPDAQVFRPDAMMNVGNDAGATDASASGSDASGPATDGGVPLDGGPGTDGGTIPVIERVGSMTVALTHTSTTVAHRYFASFFEHGDAALVTTYPDGATTCTLVDRSGPRARVRGITGAGIRISGFLAGASNIDLRPASSAGFFVLEGLMNVFTPWSNGQGALTHQVMASTVQGEITTFSDSLASLPDNGGPNIVPGGAIPANLATRVDLNAAILNFVWTPRTPAQPLVVAELSDARRELVLRCEATEAAGSLRISQAARSAFLARNPTAPNALELRYERTKLVQVPLAQSGLTVPTTIRHSAGVRYLTTP